MNLPPGSVFVHRNLGGLVNHKDLNMMSCLEYALVLGVKHVIVCGHYNCGALPHLPYAPCCVDERPACGQRSRSLSCQATLKSCRHSTHQRYIALVSRVSLL